MILQILAGIFSLLGYYYIDKNPRYAYISFTLLNATLLMSMFNIGVVVNIIFSSYFLIKTYVKV